MAPQDCFFNRDWNSLLIVQRSKTFTVTFRSLWPPKCRYVTRSISTSHLGLVDYIFFSALLFLNVKKLSLMCTGRGNQTLTLRHAFIPCWDINNFSLQYIEIDHEHGHGNQNPIPPWTNSFGLSLQTHIRPKFEKPITKLTPNRSWSGRTTC